jgi:hypothetical protein
MRYFQMAKVFNFKAERTGGSKWGRGSARAEITTAGLKRGVEWQTSDDHEGIDE